MAMLVRLSKTKYDADYGSQPYKSKERPAQAPFSRSIIKVNGLYVPAMCTYMEA